jgi:type I restriction enzyme R subunit
MSCGERRNSVPVEKSPKEKKYVSNITYFGKPVYTYSLKQKIEDGFLAPKL